MMRRTAWVRQDVLSDESPAQRAALGAAVGSWIAVLPPLYAPPNDRTVSRLLPILLAGVSDPFPEVRLHLSA